MLTLAAGLALSALPQAATAQELADPLRFLKPWVKRQLTEPEAPAVTPGIAGPEAPSEEAAKPLQSTTTAPQETPASSFDPVGPAPQVEVPLREPMPTGALPDPNAAPAPDRAAGLPLPPEIGPQDAPGIAVPEPPAVASPELPQPPLRFGVLAGRDVSATLRIVQPLAEEMQALLGQRVEILPLLSYDAMIDAQLQHRIDGGFYSAAAFAEADAQCGCLEPLVAPSDEDGVTAYHALILARQGAGIAAPADLKGRVVAVGGVDSVGSRRMQLAGLMEEGFDPRAFAGVLEVDSPGEAMRLLASGDVDAAFAWSTLAGDAASGYSRGSLTDFVAAGEMSLHDLVIIWSSPAITHGPFAVLRSVSTESKQKLTGYLERLALANPPAFDLLSPYYAGTYVAVKPEDYQGVAILNAGELSGLNLRRVIARERPSSQARATESVSSSLPD